MGLSEKIYWPFNIIIFVADSERFTTQYQSRSTKAVKSRTEKISQILENKKLTRWSLCYMYPCYGQHALKAFTNKTHTIK